LKVVVHPLQRCVQLKLREVGCGEGLVEVLGDVLPGGKPLVPVLLPGLVVLLPGSRRKCALYKFLFEVVGMDESILGAEEDGGDDLLVGEWGDRQVVGEGVLLHEGGVDPAGVDPLGLGAPAASVPAVHGAGKDGLSEEGEGEEKDDKLGREGKLPATLVKCLLGPAKLPLTPLLSNHMGAV